MVPGGRRASRSFILRSPFEGCRAARDASSLAHPSPRGAARPAGLQCESHRRPAPCPAAVAHACLASRASFSKVSQRYSTACDSSYFVKLGKVLLRPGAGVAVFARSRTSTCTPCTSPDVLSCAPLPPGPAQKSPGPADRATTVRLYLLVSHRATTQTCRVHARPISPAHGSTR